MKRFLYAAEKLNGREQDFLFWGCFHLHHNPSWDVPLWKMRGFEDVNQHDSVLVERWNSKATSDTIGFLLGDNVFGQNADVEFRQLVAKLKFKTLYVMAGNHTAGWKKLLDSIESNILIAEHGGTVIFVPNYLDAIINGKSIVMSHYPILSWNGQGGSSWMLFSHVHGSLEQSELGRMYLAKGLNREISVEKCPFPITFGELRTEMRAKEYFTPDHHSKETQNQF